MAKPSDLINSIIVDELGCEDSEVTAEAKLVDDLGADSLDTVELGMRFEEEFEFEEISIDDLEKMETVMDIYNYVETRLTQTAAK